jgi:hypothetical protein
VQSLRTGDPERIGDYAVLGRLGHGAMGTVFLARSRGGRLIAVKVARAQLSDDPAFRERFRQEIATVRAVGGFWTAAVVDADPDAPRPWLATEYVPGPTLRDAVRAHGPLPVPAVRRLAGGLAEALTAIHAAGLVHRDLKPSNVLLAADGPRVIDFGIAKALESVTLTATGMLVGTPGFLSPEQIEGRPLTPASDVFALGAVLVYAATGTGPFGSGDAAALMYRAVHSKPDIAAVPPELRALVARCLDADPGARPTPAALLAELGPPGTDEWLPDPVRTMVLRPDPPAPTRVETAPARVDSGAVFQTSRVSALVWGGLAALGSLTCGVLSDASSEAGAGDEALLLLIGCVLLGVSAFRSLWNLLRPRHRIEVSGAGLAIGKGSERQLVPWEQLARVRVVDDKRWPWLAIWFRDPRAGLGNAYPAEHGGYRVFPIGHERRKRARRREVRELRAALGWYGPNAYDPR